MKKDEEKQQRIKKTRKKEQTKCECIVEEYSFLFASSTFPCQRTQSTSFSDKIRHKIANKLKVSSSK